MSRPLIVFVMLFAAGSGGYAASQPEDLRELETVLEAASSRNHRVGILIDFVHLERSRGRHESTGFLEAHRELSRFFEAEDWKGASLLENAEIDIRANRLDSAVEQLQQVLESENQGAASLLATLAQIHFGNVHLLQSRIDSAESWYLKALHRLDGTNDSPRSLSNLLQNLSYVKIERGQLEDASGLLERSLQIAREHQIESLIVDGLFLEARLALAWKRPEAAEKSAREAVSLIDPELDPMEHVMALQVLATTLVELDRSSEALSVIDRALDEADRKDWPRAERDLGRLKAEVLHQRGDSGRAIDALLEALEASEIHLERERSSRVDEIETDHRVELLRSTIRLLRSDVRREALLRTSLLVAAVLLGFSSLLLVRSRRRQRRVNAELNRANARLEKALTHLQQEEIQHGAILEGLEEGVLETDAENRIVFANQAMAKILGSSMEELMGRPIEAHLDADLGRSLLDRLWAEAEEEAKLFELELVASDGRRRTVQFNASLVLDDLGFANGFRGSVRDITESLRDREKERAASAVLEASAAVLWTWAKDPFWSVRFVSENVLQFGFRPEDFTDRGMTYADLVHPEDLEGLEASVREAVESGRDQNETSYRIRCADGTIRWVDDRTHLIRDPTGEILEALGITVDATDRVRIELELRDSERRFRKVFESSGEGIVQLDEEGRIVLANRVSESILGALPGALVGQPLKTFLTPSARSTLEEARDEQSSGGVIEHEVEMLRTDGERRHVLLTESHDLNPDGSYEGSICVYRDITDRQRLASELQSSHGELEASVQSLRDRESVLTLVNEANQLLQSCGDRLEALHVISRSAPEILRAPGALALLDPESGGLKIEAEWLGGGLSDRRFAADDCWALRSGRRHSVRDIASDLPCGHLFMEPGDQSICIPLLVRGETLGVLCLSHRAEAATVRSGGVLEAFAEAIKLGLSNLTLRLSLQEQAIRDPLTRLFNRRYLDEFLPREIGRAVRRRVSLTCAMLDLDHFKAFNDRFGHPAGDHLLRVFSELLRSELRETDLACRMGGEEFVVVLPDATVEAASPRLESIRQRLSEQEVFYRGDKLDGVTVSIGLAQAPEHGREAEALLRAADQALFEAKSRGRNCLVAADPRSA